MQYEEGERDLVVSTLLAIPDFIESSTVTFTVLDAST